MVILVTGANGQLGNQMRLIAQQDTENQYVFTDVNLPAGSVTTHLDITDFQAIRQIVATHKVQVVVNCAAYTDVDRAETQPDLAAKINAQAPENLAKAMQEVGGLLVHISTDYVFGARPHNLPYTETDPTSPLGVYGQTKLLGEQKIIQAGGAHVIIRTSWLYSEFGKNFCKTMLELTATKPSLRVVFDQVGTPTYASDLAEAIRLIINQFDGSQSGVYHYSNQGVCSWYDFAQMIARFSLAQCDIQPCLSEEFRRTAQRPAYSVLDKAKIQKVFGVEVPYWADSLQKCIFNLKKINKKND